MSTDTTTRSFSWRNLSWLTWGLGLLATATFLAVASPPSYYYPMPLMGGGMYESQGAPMGGSGSGSAGMVPARDMNVAYPDSYPYQGSTPPATDTREFLKINYSAEMLTRDVPALTRRVLTTVRGYEGRVDQESSGPKYGYVSFALPRAKYEAFRTELEGLVGRRFLSININSSNLLPEKQSIEEQQKQADAALADYQAARTRVVNTHASTIKSLQAQVDGQNAALSDAKEQAPSTNRDITIAQLEAVLIDYRQRIVDENAAYAKQLATADAQIKYGQDWQKAVKTQDKTLLDNVATVNGTVSIRWISLWEALQLYLPGYWIPGILALITLFSAYRDRRRFRRTYV